MATRETSDMMSDRSPIKRRKTRGSHAMMPSKASWPGNALPVEIFTLIISYLPRSNIQNMRLVNKEFEEKVSEYLFKTVVVPFNPEIYGITSNPSSGESSEARVHKPPGAVMLQDKGMRVFEGFGTRIRKFAMSFEFDEAKLAYPPIKSEQEAITSFWGIYRWPYKRYNRYAQLEGLEQTADETRTMARAFRFIKCATELGISIDGGLGWLSGPDTNSKVIERGEKLAVFGESKFVPEPKSNPVRLGRPSRSSDPSSSQHQDSAYTIYERMLREAGYRGDSLESSVRIMLETEEAALSATNQAAFRALFSNQLPVNGVRSNRPSSRSVEAGTIPRPGSDLTELGLSDSSTAISDGENNQPNLLRTATLAHVLAQADSGKEKPANFSLKPGDLTTAQKEMLLEIEWAQSAFMQSYAIAVIDNPLTFKDITKLTIARLPYRHLTILRREDFWDSLSQLMTLSLAIIPDWREVVKLPTSWVQDHILAPSQSVHGVYQLLQEQISHRDKITTIHFEWLCGGEYSPGMFSRNQHILPAPLVPTAMDMVNRIHPPQILELPHVVNFSLKNCWLSPHIMCTFGLSLKRCSAVCLSFESVSLSAPLPPNARPTPIAPNTNNTNQNNNVPNLGAVAAQNVQLHFPPLIPLLPPANPPIPLLNGHHGPDDEDLQWLQPRPGSWSHIIEYLSPGLTLADLRYFYEIGPKPFPRESTKLTKLEIKSCGYVRVPLNFDQSSLGVTDPRLTMTAVASKRYNELETYMMKPFDPTLGVIVNHMSTREEATLENAWNMTVFWGQSRAELAAECLLDGISSPGDGRFDGVITAFSTTEPSR